jgi:hypothetical protein
MKSYTHYHEQLQFRGPVGLASAVATAAQRDHTTMSEFLRRTVIARLDEIGLQLESVPSANQPAQAEAGAK